MNDPHSTPSDSNTPATNTQEAATREPTHEAATNDPATQPPPPTENTQDATDFDPVFWGDTLTTDKPPATMRILLQNPNGLEPNLHYRKLDYIAKNIVTHRIDVTCLAETNVNWKKSSVRSACHDVLRKHFKHHRLITSTSTADTRYVYLPGGTATLATDGYTGRIADSGSDPKGMGRWSYVRIKGKTDTCILVVTVYQVCKSTVNSSGDSTAFTQQWNLIRASGNETPNPRSQFSSDLSEFLAGFPNDPIIIAGDINSWLRNRDDDKNFESLVRRYNLKDVLIRRHGPDSEIPTRKEGRRIDYIFASEVVADNITRCGALHFDRIVDSDHRALFADINIDEILGGKPPTLSSPALRGIDSTSAENCKRYIALLLKYLQDHHIFKRVKKLKERTALFGLTERLKAKWETVDRDMTAGCLYAERQVASRDRPAWSLELHKAHLTVVYLKIYIKALCEGKEPLQATSPFTQAEPAYLPPVVLDVTTARVTLKEAKASLQDIRKNAKAYRESFLEQRAAAAAAAGDITIEQAINIIIQREGTSRAYQCLRRYLKPGSTNSLTEVHIQRPDASIEVISTPSIMYDKIIERDLKHYNQAEGTPCTQQPVRAWLGKSGETPTCDAWLRGDATPEHPAPPFPETQTLLNHLPCETAPAPVDHSVSIDDYKEFFGKWKESTSTSQDRHLGHWKALISHSAKNDYPAEADQIIGIIVAQLNLSLQHGYAWSRWNRIVSTKIPKSAGNMLLHKLRTIHLFEADFNWCQGLVIGRRMIKESETKNRLHDNQWGTRPGRHALGAVSLKVMSYEISRLTRTPLGSFDMDATSCFDRIIIALAMYLCRRQGVKPGPCLMASAVLLHASYFIKTAHGVSPDSYTSTPANPTHGPGQGSRIGPALWVLVSCLMFHAMDDLCQGAEFCDPTQAMSHQRTGDGFVDDVANVFNFGLATMLASHHSEELIANGLQAEAQTWERLLWSTGGALELPKCFYYIMAWRFKKNGTPVLKDLQQMADISIELTSGADRNARPIEHKSCYAAHRTLGVWPTPSGNNDEQSDQCLARSNRIAEGVRLNNMARNEALMGYRHIWLPSVGYPLACWGLSYQQCYEVEKNAVSAFLPKMGFAATTSRAVIFGSKKFGGFGLTRLRDFQGVNQITLFLQHVRLSDSIGKMYQIGYSWYQHYCGTGFAVLSEPSVSLLHAPIGWFTTLRTFLADTNLGIDVAPTILRLPKPLRGGDKNLVESFCTLNWTTSKMNNLNYCRLFLQVETLAEISNTDGLSILPAAWQGRALPANSTLLWPRQERPNSWTLWRKAIAQLFLQDPTTKGRDPRNLPLRSPLGQWLPSHSTSRIWPVYQSDTRLYIRHQATYRVHRDTLAGRLPKRLFDANHIGTHSSPNTTAGVFPASSAPVRRNTILSMEPIGSFAHPDSEPSVDHPLNLPMYLEQRDPWDRQLFQYYQACQSPAALKEYLEDPTGSRLCIAHDGGATDRGSFGWCIATTDTILWEGSGHTQGLDPGSFRAESYGMLAALRFLTHYLDFYLVRPAQPDLIHHEYTDSQSLLDRLHSSKTRFYDSPKACIASDFDLEAAITATISNLPLKLSQRHVNSHQDLEEPDILRLPWQAQLNIVCDRLASWQLEVCPLVTSVTPNPYCNAYVSNGDISISGQIRKSLFSVAGQNILRTYLLKRHRWTPAVFDSIAWDACQAATQLLTIPDHRFVVKLTHKILPIGFRLQQRQSHMPTKCPTCETEIEDDWHWINCDARLAWRDSQAKSLARRLDLLETEPGLKIIFLRAFKSLLSTGDYTLPATDTTNYSPNEQAVIVSQSAIGWKHILYGRLSSEWLRSQDEHVVSDSLDSGKYSGKTWATQVTKHIWQNLLALWLLRNKSLHGDTFQENEATQRSRILPLIERLYARQHELDENDRQALFNKPLANRLAQPLSVLTIWLSVAQPAFDEALPEPLQDPDRDAFFWESQREDEFPD